MPYQLASKANFISTEFISTCTMYVYFEGHRKWTLAIKYNIEYLLMYTYIISFPYKWTVN